jgi:hypothetical protein
MVIIRDVIRYHPSGTKLIAEAKVTEEEFNKIRTLFLIGNKEPVELVTSIYWYDGGYPPKPVYMVCPQDWRGQLIGDDYVVNNKEPRKWLFEYKPVKDTGGAAI